MSRVYSGQVVSHSTILRLAQISLLATQVTLPDWAPRFGSCCRPLASYCSQPRILGPRAVWIVVVLSDIHKLKLSCYTLDALNKPVWREVTCVDAC